MTVLSFKWKSLYLEIFNKNTITSNYLIKLLTSSGWNETSLKLHLLYKIVPTSHLARVEASLNFFKKRLYLKGYMVMQCELCVELLVILKLRSGYRWLTFNSLTYSLFKHPIAKW